MTRPDHNRGTEYQVGSETKVIDPRCLVCWWRPSPLDALKKLKENTKNDFTGCEIGSDDIQHTESVKKYSVTRTDITDKGLNPEYWFNYSQESVWLGYAELQFLLAEAALRGWSGTTMSAEDYFKAGIQASMDYYQIGSAEAQSYIDGLKIYQDGNTNPFAQGDKEGMLEQIITQKWLAVFPNGNEAWAEFRRTDYPRLRNILNNRSNGEVPDGKFIKRMNYPYSEKDNPNKPLNGTYDYLAIYSPTTNSIAGSPAQIKNCAWALMQTAKLKNITIFLVGHITKEGTIAGPKILEHIVDCVLYFEGDDKGIYRILRAVKNRYGAVDEVGIFEMVESGLMEVKDPSKVFTRSLNEAVFAGSVITPVIEGSRVFCVEQEALVGSSAFGYPRRLTIGYDQYRLLIIIAILEKRCHINLSNQDVYINIANGLNVKETASDISIAMAIVSSMYGISIQRTTAYIGELGLSGEVRPVRFIERRIKEMKKFSLKEVYISKRAVKELSKSIEGVKIIGIDHISEAIKMLGVS